MPCQPGQGAPRALGTGALPTPSSPDAWQGSWELPGRRQTETPQDGRQGPQSRLSSCQVRAVHPRAGDGGPSLLVWMWVGDALPLSRGGPIPPPTPGLSVLPPAVVLFQAPRAQAGGVPSPPCRDPAGAANHRSSGSLQERKRNDRERGVRWEPGGAGQEPPPSVLTQDVEFAQRAGLLEHQPGVHAVSVELMLTGQHPEPLRGSGGRELRPQGRPPVGMPGPVPSPELGTETPVARHTSHPPPATTCSVSQISGGAGRRPVGALPRCVGSRAGIIAPAALCPGH